MGLNIKHDDVHAAVRRLAQALGVSQTSAVEIAVRAKLDEVAARDASSVDRLRIAIEEAQEAFRDVDLRAAEADLYDSDTGLPR
ncbi:MAG: type II toxin-antitoxin system VapB family antitoxin [Microbacterium sp.]|nr:type II toxin-antitoxin system VapB family antitoxin [Microbacterium sp.]